VTQEAPRGLRRAIGLPRATAMVVGTIIGASIFVQPSLVSGEVPSVAGMLLVWAAAGVLTLIGALVAAELASAFPVTGGVYVFLREAWSPAIGFLWCWAMFWSMHTGIIAAIASVCARYVGHFVPLGEAGVKAVAVAAILLLSAVNYLGVRPGSAVQTALTVVKVGAILLIIALGIGVAGASGSPAAGEAGASIIPSFRAVATAIVAGLFAFGGWHMVTYAADETKDPERTIPLALIIGTLTVTVCYMGVNVAYLHVLSPAAVASSTRVAADFAAAVTGGGGAALVSALVVISTLGAITGIILSGPRVYLAAAADGLLPRWVGAVHPRHGTPHHAIALQAIWASVLVITGTYRDLFTRVIYTEWIFFGLMAAGIFVLRRRRGYAPTYRAWGYPLLPALFIASTVLIVGNQLMADPLESATGLLIVLAGLPVYLWRAGLLRRPESANADR
jgi:APA family basic amino acid/polyamine antiporter